MADLFLVKQKVFEPNKPFHRFKPATVTVLVGAKTKYKAIEKAKENFLLKLREKFPTADVKLLSCTSINYQDFYQ